jgi:hypothetical protein
LTHFEPLNRRHGCASLTVNDEVLAFRWWSPREPVTDTMSPLDAEIARRVTSQVAL